MAKDLKNILLSTIEENKIKEKTPDKLPLNPTAEGWSGQEVRRFLAKSLIDSEGSFLAEFKKKMIEIKAQFEDVFGDGDGDIQGQIDSIIQNIDEVELTASTLATTVLNNYNSLNNLKVNKTLTILGIDLQDDITLPEFKAALGDATLFANGLMSALDKQNLAQTMIDIQSLFSGKADKTVLTSTIQAVTDLQNNKVPKATTIIGLDLQDNILLGEFKEALGNATQSAAGLLSAEDKTHLDGLVALLETSDGNNVVDTIGEILAIFQNYPEGADLVTALQGKVDKVEDKGLSTNDFTDLLKDHYDTAYAHSQTVGANPHQTTYEQLLNKPTTIEQAGILNVYNKEYIDTLKDKNGWESELLGALSNNGTIALSIINQYDEIQMYAKDTLGVIDNENIRPSLMQSGDRVYFFDDTEAFIMVDTAFGFYAPAGYTLQVVGLKYTELKAVETTYDKTTSGLDAENVQEAIDELEAKKVDKTAIVDNLTTDDATKVLSAKQGKVLNDTTAKLAVSNVFTQPQQVPNATLAQHAVNKLQVETMFEMFKQQLRGYNLAMPDLSSATDLGDGNYRLYNNYDITLDYNIYNGIYTLNGTINSGESIKILMGYVDGWVEGNTYTSTINVISDNAVSGDMGFESLRINTGRTYNPSWVSNFYNILNGGSFFTTSSDQDNNSFNLRLFKLSSHENLTFNDWQFTLQIEKGDTATPYTVPGQIPQVDAHNVQFNGSAANVALLKDAEIDALTNKVRGLESIFMGDDKALNFSNGAYVNLGNVLSIIDQDTPFAFEMDITNIYDGEFHALLTNQEPGSNGIGIQLGLGVTKPNSNLFLRLQGDKRLQCYIESEFIDNEWVHIAALYDGSRTAGGIQFTINGVVIPSLVSKSNVPGNIVSQNTTYLGVRNETEVPHKGSMDNVRIWVGTIPKPAQINHYKDKHLPQMPILFNKHKSKFFGNAAQGIATDGRYIITSNNTHIYKYSMEGSLLSSRTIGVSGFKGEDLCIVDGIIYLPITNEPTTPRKGIIQKIRVSDLSLIDSVTLNEPIHPASMAYKHDKFWLSVTESDLIYVYDKDFNLLKTHTFPVIGTQVEGSLGAGYSGLEWIGNYLYGNKHEGNARGLDVAIYNKATDSFEAIGAFNHASPGTTQGMTYDAINQKVYWAARGHNNEVWESDLSGGLHGDYIMNEIIGNKLIDKAKGNTGIIYGAERIDR